MNKMPGKFIRWTAEEVAILRAAYPTMSIKATALQIGRPASAVAKKAQELRIKNNPRRCPAEHLKAYRKTSHKQAKFLQDVAELLGRQHGASMPELISHIDSTLPRVRGYVCRAIASGAVFCSGMNRATRYYATQEAADKSCAELTQIAAICRKKKHAERLRQYQAAKRLEPKKTTSKPGAQLVSKATRKVEKPSPAKRWAESVAIVPKGVKVQRLPGYTGAPSWDMRGKTWGRP